jgi:tRNA(fMet)-specific endonuclease VapC
VKRYLLDTNACLSLINGEPAAVRKRLGRALDSGVAVLLSSIVAYELWSGVEKSQRRQFNAARLETLLAGAMEWVAFDDEDAKEAGAIRAALERVGTPIGADDVLLAGQARRRGATLVTSNVREFDRVPGLKWEDWAHARRARPAGPSR